MKAVEAMKKIDNHNEKEIRNHYLSPEQIVESLLRDGFKVSVRSIKSGRNDEKWTVSLRKEFSE